MRILFAALLLLTATPIVRAGTTTIDLRTGDHPGFGRVVFDLPPGTSAAITQVEDAATIRFTPKLAIGQGARPPRNVRALTFAPGEATLTLAPRASLRQTRIGGRLVLDIADPAPTATPMSARHGTRPARAVLDRDDLAERRLSRPDTQSPQPPVVTPAPPPRPETLQIAAEPTPPPPAPASPTPAPAMLLPFDPDVGAAAFRRGNDAVVVFDQRRPIDLAALRNDRAFARANVQLLPAAVVLRLPIDRQDELVLTRSAPGWTVTVVPSAAAPRPAAIAATFEAGAVRFIATAAGDVVSVPDPETGGTLQVGTLRQPGEAQLVGRRNPEFGLPLTWLGALVEPVSERPKLRATQTGFLLAADPPGTLDITPGAHPISPAPEAHLLTRRFDFPAVSVEGLQRRLQALRAGAGAASASTRTARRMDVAEAMIAIGLGVEAQSLLNLIGADDGGHADDPARIGLYSIAALAAGRPQDAAGIDDPRLGNSDEIALWRAIRMAALDDAKAAAPVFAANFPLLLAYPEPLRARFLPLVAETLATQAGSKARDAAHALLDLRSTDRSLDLARAFLLQGEVTSNDIAPVLDALAKVATGPDRFARARAATTAVELRLANGLLTPPAAADALDRLLYAWRGDDREIALRSRVAELRGQTGQWRQALALLRETTQLFPESATSLHPLLRSIFASAIAADRITPMPPLDLVTLAEENADLIPDGEPGQRVAIRIADRLASLDLPHRAARVLEKLAAAAPPGLPRTEIGTHLALVRQSIGDHAGALDALNASAAPEIPPALLETRTLAFARSAANLGDAGSAAEALAKLGTTPALTLRADLLEAAKDWPSARAALRDLAERTVPPQGRLTEEQALVLLRLATAAAQLADSSLLAALREHDLARFPPGKLTDLFTTLTAGPVQGVSDLPRAAREARLAGTLPAALKSLTR